MLQDARRREPLVQHPTQDPVITVSALSERLGPGKDNASLAATRRGNAVMLAGIKEWEVKLGEMEDTRPK